MAFYHRNTERKRIQYDYGRQEEEVVGSLCRLGNRPASPKSLLEQEKRIRREIANSNERRRMQSINAGFQSLRAILPHREGEKLSKAAILQSTTDYVYQLEQEKTRLLEQNSQLSRRIQCLHSNHDSDGSFSDSPLPKRKKLETADFVDEGIGSSSPSRSENGNDDVKREIIDLRIRLEHERALRLLLEDQLRNMESRLFALDSDHVDNIHLAYTETEHASKSALSTINLGHESGLGSPQSQVSSQDLESAHELSMRESSPEPSPEDLSGKSCSVLLPSVDELTFADAAIPELLMPTDSLNVAPPLSLEISISSKPTNKASTSKQNLETIVEAIRHVEGDHMFRDDPTSDPKLIGCSDQDSEQFEKQIIKQDNLLVNADFSLQHKLIQSAPLMQSRPGVIVSHLS